MPSTTRRLRPRSPGMVRSSGRQPNCSRKARRTWSTNSNARSSGYMAAPTRASRSPPSRRWTRPARRRKKPVLLRSTPMRRTGSTRIIGQVTVPLPRRTAGRECWPGSKSTALADRAELFASEPIKDFRFELAHRRKRIGCRRSLEIDVGGAPGEKAARAIRRDRRHGVAIALDAVGERNLRRVAAGLAGRPLQPRYARAIAGQRVEQMTVVAADRIPCIAQTGRAAQGGPAFAADPDWRVRRLDRLRFEGDARKPDPPSGVAGRALGPQRLERADILVRDRATRGKGRGRNRIKLGFEPAGANADGKPSTGQNVERREHFSGEHRRPVGYHHDRQDQSDMPGHRRNKGSGGQLLVAPLRALAKELAAFRIGVAWNLEVGQDDVIGQGQIVVAKRFAFTGDATHCFGVRKRARIREVKSELQFATSPDGRADQPVSLALGRAADAGNVLRKNHLLAADPGRVAG